MLAAARIQRLLLVVLLLLLVAIAAVLLSSRGSTTAPAGSASLSGSRFAGPTLPPGLRAADFSLLDERGHRVTLAALRGRIVVLTFIHSQCHDTCPFMVQQIKGALNLLPAQGQGVSAVGLSVAPAEDTAPSRRAFLRRMGMEGRLAFVNGTEAQMRRVWRAYAMQPVQGPVDHSTFVLLVDRQGRERVGFPADQLTPEGLAHDLRLLERQPS